MWKPSRNDGAFCGSRVADQLWMPGFLSFAAGAVIVFWGLHQFQLALETFAEFASLTPAARASNGPVSFDENESWAQSCPL
jgi:hypothetical protein